MLMRHIKYTRFRLQWTQCSEAQGSDQLDCWKWLHVGQLSAKGERAASFNRLLHAAARSIAPSLAMVQATALVTEVAHSYHSPPV